MIKKAIALLVIDIIFIRLFLGNIFLNMLEKIQGKPVVLNIVYAAVTYFLILLGNHLFITPLKKIYSTRKYYTYAFLFGIVTYGIYDFTNLALLSDYKLSAAIIDTLWGGTLNALLAYF